MLLISLLLPALASALIVVPQPAGPYGISLTDYDFVDKSRTDPYSGSPGRVIPASIITPIGPAAECRPVQQPYLPNATANFVENEFGALLNLSLKNTFSQLALSTCKPTHNFHHYPLIFFSPGEGTPRQLYHILCTHIAAQGYTVVTVDAPGEPGSFTSYLNGSVRYGSNATANPPLEVTIRAQNIEFIRQRLSVWPGRFDTSAPIAFGHSLGGNTATTLVIGDNTFIGGINLDGGIDGLPLNTTTERPFLLLTSDMPGAGQHNQSTLRGWAATWVDLLGPRWQLQMLNSYHDTFSDAPTIANLLGLYKYKAFSLLLGTINATESFNILVSTMSTMAAYLSGQKDVESIIDQAEIFPEVVVVNATKVGR